MPPVRNASKPSKRASDVTTASNDDPSLKAVTTEDRQAVPSEEAGRATVAHAAGSGDDAFTTSPTTTTIITKTFNNNTNNNNNSSSSSTNNNTNNNNNNNNNNNAAPQTGTRTLLVIAAAPYADDDKRREGPKAHEGILYAHDLTAVSEGTAAIPPKALATTSTIPANFSGAHFPCVIEGDISLKTLASGGIKGLCVTSWQSNTPVPTVGPVQVAKKDPAVALAQWMARSEGPDSMISVIAPDQLFPVHSIRMAPFSVEVTVEVAPNQLLKIYMANDVVFKSSKPGVVLKATDMRDRDTQVLLPVFAESTIPWPGPGDIPDLERKPSYIGATHVRVPIFAVKRDVFDNLSTPRVQGLSTAMNPLSADARAEDVVAWFGPTDEASDLAGGTRPLPAMVATIIQYHGNGTFTDLMTLVVHKETSMNASTRWNCNDLFLITTPSMHFTKITDYNTVEQNDNDGAANDGRQGHAITALFVTKRAKHIEKYLATKAKDTGGVKLTVGDQKSIDVPDDVLFHPTAATAAAAATPAAAAAAPPADSDDSSSDYDDSDPDVQFLKARPDTLAVAQCNAMKFPPVDPNAGIVGFFADNGYPRRSFPVMDEDGSFLRKVRVPGSHFFAVRYEGGKYFLRKYAVNRLPDHDVVTSAEPVPLNANALKAEKSTALSATAVQMLAEVSRLWHIRFILTHTRYADVSHLGLSKNPMKYGFFEA